MVGRALLLCTHAASPLRGLPPWLGLPLCLPGPGAAVPVICPHSPVLLFLPHTAELRLEGNFLHRLPNEVSTLQHLKAIDLSRNQFRDFPEQLTTLPALETINLEENDIVGERPRPCGPRASHCLQFLPLPSLSAGAHGVTGHRHGAPGSDLHRHKGQGEPPSLRHLSTGH